MSKLPDKSRRTIFRIVLGVAVVALAVSAYHIWIQLQRSYENITVEQAKELIETEPSLVILDVRTDGEFNSGHIKGAINIPVDELQQRLEELNPNEKILVYCRTGNRSSRAAKILADNGFLNVYNMLGGIEAWKEAGYPISY